MAKNSVPKQLPVQSKDSLPNQEIVNLFKRTFDQELYRNDPELLTSKIQEVKSFLYNREYLDAFNNDEKRTAYCIRWSSSRSISYASLLTYFESVKDIIQCNNDEDNEIICIGGGAGGELIALASIFTTSREITSKYSNEDNTDASEDSTLTVNLVDIADWNNVIDRINKQIYGKWIYGESNKKFKVNCINEDILKMQWDGESCKADLKKTNLITMLFTTNELFVSNKTASVKLLQKFNAECQKGCYLLIVESAGSYSHITIGSKKFPIHFLIDTILVGRKTEKNPDGSWSLVSEHDSLWYRCDSKLDYPLKLENMRFFYRLYRKN